jgi:UDP-glucose 4-epimerase
VTWIVTGGAGYIGAHVVRRMCGLGRDVVVFDDLSTGRADRLPAGAELVRGSITDAGDLARLFAGRRIAGVIHLAALKSVAESVADPIRYQQHNVGGLQRLLDAMRAACVRRILFSSSAAVYGRPDRTEVDEATPTVPTNPYGSTKLDGERLIARAGVRSLVLRQFNVIGAGTHPAAADTGATNLLPAAFRALGPDSVPVEIQGTGYPTRDGTAERDYVHIDDVAAAYLLGVQYLTADGDEPQLIVNVGTGRGHTVREVLDAVGTAAGRPVRTRDADRRPGDVPAIRASTERAATRLHWKAERDFDEAVRSAWRATSR